jgi:hypothetical protein
MGTKALNHQPENQQWMSNIESQNIKLQHDCEKQYYSKRKFFWCGWMLKINQSK